ncbi:MAG TPA: hypothetical protein G4O05_05490, partial [Caldilineae bacterium]|nr:hypothetical protein [Caldilineae bacterium]
MAERVRTALEETPPPPHSLRPGRSTFLSAGAQRPSRRWESAISNIGRSLMGLMPFATVFALALLLSTVYIFTRFWHTPALTDRWSKPSPSPMVASPVFSSDQALETATKGPGDSSGASNLESPSHDRSPAAPTQTPTASAPAAPTTNKGAPSTPALAPTHASEETPASITPTDAPDLTPSVTPTPPLAPTLTPTPPPPSITNTPAATITPPRRPPRTPPSRP